MSDSSDREGKQPKTKNDTNQPTADKNDTQIQYSGYGFHVEFKENEGWDIRFGKLKLNSWYGTLIILGIVLAVFILFSELSG